MFKCSCKTCKLFTSLVGNVYLTFRVYCLNIFQRNNNRKYDLYAQRSKLNIAVSTLGEPTLKRYHESSAITIGVVLAGIKYTELFIFVCWKI